jgi:hypothetical protein
MPCIVDPPSVTESEWLSHMLCKACRFLTKEQIQSISGLDCYLDLDDWYRQHLMHDFSYFNGLSNIKEYHDAPFSFVIHAMPEEIEELKIKENNRIKIEAKKMGYEILIYKDGAGVQCKYLSDNEESK